MFVRKKKNKSGSTSVQIIDKTKGQYRVLRTVGNATREDEIICLVEKARDIIRTSDGKQLELFVVKNKEEQVVEKFLKNLSNSQVQTIGPEAILGTLFDRIGFNVINEELFRHLVIARLAYPVSKLKTVDYLQRYRGVYTHPDMIYRFLDKLRQDYKAIVEKVAFEYTRETLRNISVVFYDMTTLYFEAEDEDDLRKIGFSKDGKFQKPQIMLGLLVGKNGYPIGYDIFEGNVFEGKTLLPTLEQIRKRYNFENPIVVADAALLSKANLQKLQEQNYTFIIGGRIKNESDEVKKQILKKASGIKDGETIVIDKNNKTRLIVGYSASRHKKDAYNRQRGLKKLKQRVSSGRLTKEHINNRGYNKFLTLTGDIEVSIDEDKVKGDSVWDGLKGYVTNCNLNPKGVIENYRHLWQIEKAFRISKTDLRIRPIHHYRRKRIESHICIAFVAYTIYKELERLLAEKQIGFSVKRAIELTHNMYQIVARMPNSTKDRTFILKMDSDQEILYNLVNK
jgi:transposase